jgi:hypothetical protein
MRILIAIVAVAAQAALAASPPSQSALDFMLGELIGKCLIVRCQVFRGSVLTDAPKSGEAITLRVEEPLFGVEPGTSTLEIPYQPEVSIYSLRAGHGVPWAGVTVSHNSEFTVVLAGSGPRVPNSYMGFRPNSVVFVAAGGRSEAIVRLLAMEAEKIEDSPAGIVDAVASLAGEPRPALSGYLTVYLDIRETAVDPDLECVLLSRMVGSPSLPNESLGFVLAPLVANYFRLAVSTRSEVVQRLASFGQGAGGEPAAALFNALGRIAEFDHSVAGMIGPLALDALTENYRALIKRGKIPANRSFETELGKAHE